ncbi:hypothetical protein LEP1GSC067_2991 [Leptospira interrogans serovar Lora str. TE 1992]|uniref:Uncharacterized protein n=1 Tax=Leptospira interrogans serovar Lora str. TE 1992 TaxID=1193028 RepID=M3ET27_LEPIR|nr:hypothetical protein LEP1GSC067_2991 [Leptospira interrogans serovar Lora str. TE 1992]
MASYLQSIKKNTSESNYINFKSSTAYYEKNKNNYHLYL